MLAVTHSIATRSRRRTSATRPNAVHWLKWSSVATVLLAAVALSPQVIAAAAESEPASRASPARARSADSGALLEIVEGAPALVTDEPWPDTYSSLLERARREVRLEEQEQQNRRKIRDDADALRTGHDARGIRVVRETFYIPPDHLSKGGRPDPDGPDPDPRSNAPNGSPSLASVADSTAPADFRQIVGKLRCEFSLARIAPVASRARNLLRRETPITRTLSANLSPPPPRRSFRLNAAVLRPLFTYAVHHPLRLLISYLISPLLSLAWTLLVELVSLVLLAFSPATYLVSIFVWTPMATTARAVSSLAPVLYALAGAVAVGAGLGALGGVVSARTTRHVVETAVETTQRCLRWLGILPKHGRDVEDEAEEGTEGEGVYGESYAELSSEAERVVRAVSEVEDDDDEQLEPKYEEVAPREEEEEGAKEDPERQRANEAATARANRIEALRYRVKLEGAGPPVLVA